MFNRFVLCKLYHVYYPSMDSQHALWIYHDVIIGPGLWDYCNRPFPSSPVPLFQNESKCETFHMKMSSACSFILMKIKVIFIRMVSHLDSLWNRGTRELGNGLLALLSLSKTENSQQSVAGQQINLTITCFRLTAVFHQKARLEKKPS